MHMFLGKPVCFHSDGSFKNETFNFILIISHHTILSSIAQ